MRRQPAVRGGRERLGASVVLELERAVAFTARRFGCSKSWVQAVALGQFFGIPVEHFDDHVRQRHSPTVPPRRAKRTFSLRKTA